jgi:hypothetical protein
VHLIRLFKNARRLRALSAAEAKWRLGAIVRTNVQRADVWMRGARWERAAIGHTLIPGILGAEADRAFEREDWLTIDRELRRALRQRPTRFVIDPGSAKMLRREIVFHWPDAPEEAAADADAVVAGRFDLLGYQGLSFVDGGHDPADWHWDPVHARRMPRLFWAQVPFLDPQFGDHKVVWELNRHQYFLRLGRAWWLTGDARYRNAIVAHLRSWLAANPPLIGANWASMLELAFRSLSWVAAIHFLLADVPSSTSADDEVFDTEPWLLDTCVALDRQLRHVEQNLSLYFSPNTHLTGEALALYVTGVALPEFARSARWIDLGRRVLMAEVARQIADDGGHAERSTHYHRYTLDFYELALLTAERAGDVDAVGVFSEAVARLEYFMRAMADDNGKVPQLGDDDGGRLWPIKDRDPRDVRDSLALAALVLNRHQPAMEEIPEEAFWMAWSGRAAALQAGRSRRTIRRTPVPAVDARVFPTTGYVIMRSRAGDHLVFDVGPHGFLNGGHAHADALALTLSIAGHPFLIDPGTGTYTMDRELRDRLRATASHNTLTLDGLSSARPSGPFNWATRADSRLDAWRHTTGFAWAEGSHSGFSPAIHRRTVFYTEAGGCLVIDEVNDDRVAAEHTATVHWHFDPEWTVTPNGPRRLLATHWTGRTAWIVAEDGDLSMARGEDTSAGGWCSPRYGVLVPTSTARATRSARGSLVTATWLGDGRLADAPVLERVTIDADRSSPAVAVRLDQGGWTRVTMVRPGDALVRHDRRSSTPEYDSDARLLHYATSANGLVELSMADSMRTRAHGDRLLSVDADQPIPELHASIRDGSLDLLSSLPPGRLHLTGDVLSSVQVIRLNGRNLQRVRHSGAAVTLVGGDWGEWDRIGGDRSRPITIGIRSGVEAASESAGRGPARAV